MLAGLPGGGHTVVRADLADAEAVRQMVEAAAADLGGLDVLVNNAGIYLWHPITEVSYEQWQEAWRETLGRQPDRRRQRDLVRRAAYEGDGRPDRQRDLTRRVPR